MNAVIIGGGIGGLTAAIALRKAGIDARVYERAPEPREVGAGISLWANALLALRSIGAEEGVRRRGEAATYAAVRTWRGRMLMELDQTATEFGVPRVTLIHRAELLEALLACLPDGVVDFGRACTGVEQDAGSATAQFAEGAPARGDVLIGADGINSVVRGTLLNDGPPRYSGYTCWRAVTVFPTDTFPAGHIYELWGRGARFGLTRIGSGRVYWWATHNCAPGGTDTDARAELLERFRGWATPVCEVIGATEDGAFIRGDIIDRPPSRRWGRGRITLLGDAAHPTTPNLGQGGCMAIEDGVVLARELGKVARLSEPCAGTGRPVTESPANGADATEASHTTVEAALRAYESARYTRTARITVDSWRFGVMGQWENAALRGVRDLVLRLTPRRVLDRQARALLRFEG